MATPCISNVIFYEICPNFSSAGMLHFLVYSITICMSTSLLILLNKCLPLFLPLQKAFFFLSSLFCPPLMQVKTSTLNHLSLSLLNFGAPYLLLYFQLPMTWLHLKWSFQDIFPFLSCKAGKIITLREVKSTGSGYAVNLTKPVVTSLNISLCVS